MGVRYCTGKRSQTATKTSRRAYSYEQSSDVRDVMRGATAARGNTASGNAQATVKSYSGCTGKGNPAPANAASIVDTADARASGYLQSASVFSFLAGFGEEQKLSSQNSAGYQAYLTRFGPPEKVGKVYRNRFSGATYATESAARVQELYSLSDRFDQLSEYLDGGIRYICNTGSLNISTCTDSCSANPNWVLWTCAKQAAHSIAICPAFWKLAGGDSQRGIGVIHELAHQRFGIPNHLHGNERQRGNNPECYASYVADTFGIAPFDLQCPPV